MSVANNDNFNRAASDLYQTNLTLKVLIAISKLVFLCDIKKQKQKKKKMKKQKMKNNK